MKPTDDDFVEAIQNAISRVPGVNNLEEAEYCELVGGALDVVLTGIKMREEELENEEDD